MVLELAEGQQVSPLARSFVFVKTTDSEDEADDDGADMARLHEKCAQDAAAAATTSNV